MLTKEQIEFRKTGIGGSDVFSLCGENPKKTTCDLYLEKIREVEPEYIEDDFIKTGNKLEPILINLYMKHTQNDVEVSEKNKNIRSPKKEFMIANIDGFIKQERSILECKTQYKWQKKQWGEPGTDQMPERYLMQCIHYANVLDVDTVDVIVSFLEDAQYYSILNIDQYIPNQFVNSAMELIASHDFKIYTYRRKKEHTKTILEVESDFWFNHVKKKTPPLNLTYKDCLKLWKPHKEESRLANEDIQRAVENIKEIKRTVAELEKAKEMNEVAIARFLQNSSILQDALGIETIATWKANKNGQRSLRIK